MTTEKKQSNRAIQRLHATYKKKSEISESLNLIKPYINASTYKFLSHFLHTGGSGVTQAKNNVICEKVGIAERTYYKTVKPEIENTFRQPLIITTEAPMKMDKNRKKRVKASPFKSLMPLEVIKHLVAQKEQDETMELNDYWTECETIEEPFSEESAVEGAVKSAVECAVESIEPIPCESKDEDHFQSQQNNSFREKHLEKSIYNNINRLRTDSFSPKKYRLKKEVKNILNRDMLIALNEEQRQEFGNRIQIALKRTEADIKDEEIQNAIFEGCYGFIIKYEKNPMNINEDYYGALYVCIENAIYDCLIAQEQENDEENDYEESDEYLEDIELGEHEGKHGYNGEHYQSNMKREAFKEQRQAYSEIVASREELDALGVW